MSSNRSLEGEETADRPLLGAVDQALTALDKALTQDLWRLQGPELGELLDRLDLVRRGTERLIVAVVTDAVTRGVAHDEGFSSVTDYVTGHCPFTGVGEAAQVVKVAQACREGRNAALAEAVTGGQVSARKAFQVADALDKIHPFLEFEEYEERLGELIRTALMGTDAQLRRQVRDIIDQSRPPVDSDVFAGKQHQARSLTEHNAGGGMTEFRWRLAPEGAAFVKAAIDPLSTPQPDDDGADLRSPAQRRSDALMMILQRGMGSPGAAPSTARAKVVITLSWEQLIGQLRGLGTTLTGDQLTPTIVRRVACDADLIPMLLGSKGEVLDLGQGVRLASPAQRLVLWHRQKQCTYQGCSMPAVWCDAHHATWWSRGGPTDIDNLYLLCGRHHTRVHERDLSPVRHEDDTIHWGP